MPYPNITAIILAAGFASRMGAFKPLLPLGGRTALERCVSGFRAAGVEDVRVVTGHRGNELAPLLCSLNARAIVNEQPEQGMFSSVCRAIEDMAGSTCRAGLILPVDLCTVRPETIAGLCASWSENAAPVALPSFLGKTGHPALFSAKVFQDIQAWTGPKGLRGWMMQRLTRGPDVVPVPDAGILMDMDRPEDAARLESRLRRTLDLAVPAAEECLALHLLFDPSPERARVRAHCLAVARTALRLGATLLQAGQRLSLELLTSAALVHDVAKGRPGHAARGATFVHAHGYASLAGLVARHHDLDASDEPAGPELDVLRLADLLVQEDRCVDLDQRFQATRERFSDDAEALRAISRKHAAAVRLRNRVAERLGQDAEQAALIQVDEKELLEGFMIRGEPLPDQETMR